MRIASARVAMRTPLRPAKKPAKTLAKPPSFAFNVDAFLDSAGTARVITKYPRSAVVFSQGDAASDVFYLQKGSVKLSVRSRIGKEAVVGIFGPGHFFGEGCLAGQPRRMATALALAASTVLVRSRSPR